MALLLSQELIPNSGVLLLLGFELPAPYPSGCVIGFDDLILTGFVFSKSLQEVRPAPDPLSRSKMSYAWASRRIPRGA